MPVALALSFLLHVCLLLCLIFPLKKQEITSSMNTIGSTHVRLVPQRQETTYLKSTQTQKKQETDSTPKQNHKRVLSQKQSMSDFLPRANQTFLKQLREQQQINSDFQAQGGDVPVLGKSMPLVQMPKTQDRYRTQDLSLFQFSQEFRNRFGAIWNEQDRIVPPASPLRPGDVVFYKIYINDDGTLNRYENVSAKRFSSKDFSHLDVLFSDVIARVFPMKIPEKFSKKGNVITEMIAIQVVDRNLPMKFSF